MTSKTGNIGILNTDRLSVGFSEIIKKRHRDLIRVTNAGMVTLFWEIGKELNQNTAKRKMPQIGKSVMAVISTRLMANYGYYFTEKNLKKMRQFASQFPDFAIITQIAPFVSWEHIKLLLKEEDWDTMLSYISLTIEQGLSVNGLRKQIYANVFKSRAGHLTARTQGLPGNKSHTRKFLKIFQRGLEQTTRNNLVLGNVFKEPLLSSFRPLMDISKQQAHIGKNKKKSSIEEKLFEVLSQHIDKYRYRHNRWLNAYLNLSLWEMGKRFNREIMLNNKEDKYQKSIVRNASVQLEKKYATLFSEKQLYQMAKFAEQFSDSNIAVRISYLVSWEHIPILLSLKEIEARLFYARLAATQGLNVAGLRKLIAKKLYEKTSGAKEREQSTIAALQKPFTKTRIEKKGNKTFTGMSVYIDIEDNLVVPNIFKNPYLPLFMLSPAKISDRTIVSPGTAKKIK